MLISLSYKVCTNCPLYKGSYENATKIQKELLVVTEVLKQKLVDEKAEKFYLETKIREEVCQVMAEQLPSLSRKQAGGCEKTMTRLMPSKFPAVF